MITFKEFIELLEEDVLTTQEREELATTQFGLPRERKYPIHDSAHVRNAISRFHFAEEKKRKELATNIKRAAKKFGIEIDPDAEISKYI